jgi:hypothetical protein
MKRAPWSLLAIVMTMGVGAAFADEPAAKPEAKADAEAGKKAFLEVARVLQSPRCVNCHPAGDAPLQGDALRPHAMNITRASVEAGLACATCHQDTNSESVGVKGGPPGAPRWGLPAKDMPLVFQGLTASELCAQMKDPARNGHKDARALLEHVDHDPLVLWGWAPGGRRTLPPLTHAAFVEAWKTWTASGFACP